MHRKIHVKSVRVDAHNALEQSMIVINAYLHSTMYFQISVLAIMESDFTIIRLLRVVVFAEI